MAREKIPAVKIKPGENSRIIIKKLLGYKSSKTTKIYTYISTKNLSAIKNSLDSPLKEDKIKNKKQRTKSKRDYM